MSDDNTRPRVERRQLPRHAPAAARRWETEKTDLESKVDYWRARARHAESERDHLFEQLRDLRSR